MVTNPTENMDNLYYQMKDWNEMVIQIEKIRFLACYQIAIMFLLVERTELISETACYRKRQNTSEVTQIPKKG